MEIINLVSTTLFILAVTAETYSDGIATRNEGSVKPPLVVNPIEHLTLDHVPEPKPEHSLAREKRQNINQQENRKPNDVEKPKTPPNFNPLEDLILNEDKNVLKPGSSLSRVKRQYGESESNSIETEEYFSDTGIIDDDYGGRYPYPYPYPIPIFIGGGFGGFGGRGFGGRGFGGGFGGRGFGGGFGGRGFGGGFGGRGVGGGFGGGRGGGGGRG